ncbi:hypothetical protein [Streptomyces violascens]|uniref:Integral membrane protein n=1 Tax=Streptomyces violascens TaxID=67381 RepID=A0ABQ3QWP1_9ACTN|nr:hypothetical protein [Streptomyces violascens]GGU11778.1 hypothetical protein GCM10010289_36370 [Streptomyces violascens]GHI41688.1 hypothetical protein Sviol_60960 [Streptomyces violascens]
MLSFIALAAIAGLVTAVGAEGPRRRLGGTIAIVALSCLALMMVLGPLIGFFAISAFGVALAALPPFAPTARTARRVWLAAVFLAEAALITGFSATQLDMIALYLLLFGPGALVAAARLMMEVRDPDKA